jgi:hypothetical protein
MSVLLLQIGQCGNQIGCKLFANLINQINNSSECLAQNICDTYFRLDNNKNPIANSLLIDMEAKVIERCLRSKNPINI